MKVIGLLSLVYFYFSLFFPSVKALATAEFAGASLGLGSGMGSSNNEKVKHDGGRDSSRSGAGDIEEERRAREGPLTGLRRRIKQRISDAGASAADTLGQVYFAGAPDCFLQDPRVIFFLFRSSSISIIAFMIRVLSVVFTAISCVVYTFLNLY